MAATENVNTSSKHYTKKTELKRPMNTTIPVQQTLSAAIDQAKAAILLGFSDKEVASAFQRSAPTPVPAEKLDRLIRSLRARIDRHTSPALVE